MKPFLTLAIILGALITIMTDKQASASTATLILDTTKGQIEIELKPNLAPNHVARISDCLLYTSPSPRDRQKTRMPSSA